MCCRRSEYDGGWLVSQREASWCRGLGLSEGRTTTSLYLLASLVTKERDCTTGKEMKGRIFANNEGTILLFRCRFFRASCVCKCTQFYPMKRDKRVTGTEVYADVAHTSFIFFVGTSVVENWCFFFDFLL